MSGCSRQMYCTWSRVSNIAKHSLALNAGGESVSRNTVTVSFCATAKFVFNNPTVSTSSLWYKKSYMHKHLNRDCNFDMLCTLYYHVPDYCKNNLKPDVAVARANLCADITSDTSNLVELQ